MLDSHRLWSGICLSARKSETAGITSPFRDLTTIAAGLARALTSRDTTALVLDRDARLLANGRLLPEEPIPAPPDPTYTTRALAGENEITYITTVADQRTLVLLIPLRPAPGSPEVLGLVQLSTLLALIDQILWRQRLLIAGGTLMTIIAGTLGGLWLTSSALAPLRRMIVTSRRIAAGDLSQRVDLPRHTDEVGQLAASFDDMVARMTERESPRRTYLTSSSPFTGASARARGDVGEPVWDWPWSAPSPRRMEGRWRLAVSQIRGPVSP